jgi:hypothetical protein
MKCNNWTRHERHDDGREQPRRANATSCIVAWPAPEPLESKRVWIINRS